MHKYYVSATSCRNPPPQRLDKDLLVKLPVDRKGSCSVIPRKFSCHFPRSGGENERKSTESDSSDKRSFNRQIF